jgi:DNA polymerase/3'-5' exonuclease PolX
MGTGKLDLGIARPLADRILEHISPALDRGQVAGSIRREKPVVGDLEIVGITADGNRLVSLLSEVGMLIKPGVPGVVPWTPKSDAKYVRVHLAEHQVNLDLFLGHRDNWGGLLMMRTGSGAGPDGNPFNGFTPRMFSMWKRVSGGGRMVNVMPTLPSGESIPVPEEDDMFRVCQVEWVEPRERVGSKAVRPIAH